MAQSDCIASEIQSFRIISMTEGRLPVGIGNILPTSQNVTIGGRVEHWSFEKVKEKDDIYRLRVTGHRATGVEDQKVIASVLPAHDLEWKVIYHEHQDAYTIALARDPGHGWTVPPALSGSSAVEIRPIVSTKSIPPQYIPSQLFKLLCHD